MKACSPPRWSEQRSPGTTTTTLCSHCSRMSPTSSPRLTHWSSRSGRSAEWPRGLGEQRTTTSCGTTRFLVPEVPRASERNQRGTTSPQPSRTPLAPSARPSIERRQWSTLRLSSTSASSTVTSSARVAVTQNSDHLSWNLADPLAVPPVINAGLSDKPTPWKTLNDFSRFSPDTTRNLVCDKEKEVRPLVGDPVPEVLRGDVQLLCTVGQVSHIKVKKTWMRDNFTKGVCSKIERPGQEGTTQQPTRTMLTQLEGATAAN